MAKSSAVMFDAEIADGDIAPITSAIQNALRGPAPAAVQRLSPPAKAQEANDLDAQDAAAVEPDHAGIDATEDTARQRAPRKPPATPNVIEIEMDESVSLASFAHGKDSKSHPKRYLIAASWLKEHRNIEAVSADHIYTCYRKLNWPTNIPDFVQPLRDLKAQKYFTQPDKGLYAINHIGLDRVKKLGGE